ncbi:leukocyte elastase inhibitor [Tetranychus urticae]|uniref:Serpin domain-containing protein n=1 Tax=Tetranychus urticae TaxID=32264 RepID=T1JQ78_TETUR|nr:leukocyte elastase inhibitor [Tetranychus urticae]XP_025017384.1 leukocyte elastase inhibitor [Tetranychus urticae]
MIWSSKLMSVVILSLCLYTVNCGNTNRSGIGSNANQTFSNQLADSTSENRLPSSSTPVTIATLNTHSTSIQTNDINDALDGQHPQEPSPSTQATPPLEEGPKSPPKFPKLSDELSQNVSNIVASNNQFGFKLFKALNKFHGNENILISPLSLFSTLVTVYAGSSASTEDEMISLLQLRTMTEAQIQTAFRDVLHSLLNDVGKKNSLKLLNAIFIDKDYNVSTSYVDKVRTYYNAYLEKVGFSTEPTYVVKWANELVSWWTQGLIPNLLDSLDPLTRLLLINVIYFKGVWSAPFNQALTNEQAVFRNFDQTKSIIPMMRSISSINYHCDYVNVQACVVEKLYSGGSISFLVITPTNGTDLKPLEAALGSQLMYELISQLQENTVELGLPRFSLSGSYDLLKPLEYLGMKAAFSPKKADLSKMGNSKELFVKEAKHKTVLQVTEEGTLAAGATVAEIGTRKRSPRIIIDRPFIFLIRDLKTDAILFLGRVNSL